MVVLEEIRKMSRDYNIFIFLVGYDLEVLGIPLARRCTPISKEKTTTQAKNMMEKKTRVRSRERVRLIWIRNLGLL